MSGKRLKKAVPAVIAALAVLLFVQYSVPAAQADLDSITAAAAEIIYDNEGGYDSVNPNDNGALSIGKLQWHGPRALSLLKSIVAANKEQAQKLLGNTLYKEINSASSTSAWGSRKLTSAEASAVKKLLATAESKTEQDTLANKDIAGYIQQGMRLGITNEPALVYFADVANQGGAGSASRTAASASKYAGSYGAVTLNEFHQAAICDSVMGKSAYYSRRFATYVYAAGLGWTYCSASDSYIPNNYTAAKEKGAAWIQRSLNTCMSAGLTVSGSYDEATKAAVKKFQSAEKLSVDGYAGKDTIVALIKAVFSGSKVTPSADPPSQPENPTNPSNPSTPDVPDQPQTPAKQAVLKTSKKSYEVNRTQGTIQLKVTSNHSQAPITYQSSDKSVAAVSSSGKVTVKGAGQAQITAAQAKTDTYAAAQLKITVTVYSIDPADYTVPTGALYAGKTMKKQHVQWLQAAMIVLDKADITVNGVWSDKLTRIVTDFQAKCGLEADGIAGTQTQDAIRRLLAVKAKTPSISVKSAKNANTVTWKKYNDANRVYIYRKEKGNSYKRIKTISNMAKTSFQDKTAKKGIRYYYKVKFGCVQGSIKTAGLSSKAAEGMLK